MKKRNKYTHIYEPIRIGNVTLKNRIMSPPMMSGLATPEGQVTQELIAFARRMAKSGAGLVVMGETSIDLNRAPDHVHGTNIGSDAFVPRYALLTEEIHRYGAKASIELNHPGALAFPVLLEGKKPYSPSPLPEYIHPVYKNSKVEIMDKAAMQSVIESYVAAVGRCIAAGFDMVMIHAGHGWLLGQFLSPSFNQRTDEYGGSLENRMRFPLEVLSTLRNTYGDKIAIDLRVSGASRVPKEISGGEMEIDELILFLKEAQKYVDMVNFSAGFIPYLLSLEYMIPSYLHPHQVNAEFAAKAKKELNIPVSAVGGFVTVEEADKFIAEGNADIVAIGRASLADPMIFIKSQQGREDEIRPCIRCSYCGGRSEPPYFKPIRCAVNPQIGRETEYPCITAAAQRRKVMIIGGGPAGMEATQRCVERGHEVVLYEKSETLGGMLYTASALPFKGDMRKYTEWMVKTTMDCGAKIVLGVEATPETIKKENPDVVLVAIGAVPAIPPIPGINGKNVVWAGDVDTKKVETGNKVVIAGAGLTGAECAIELVENGKEVTLVDMIPAEAFVKDAAGMVKMALSVKYENLKIPVIFESVITEITDTGLKYKDKDGNVHELFADTVINALGMRVERQKVEELLSVVPESYDLGDCSGRALNILSAVRDGFSYAMDI